MTAKRDKYDSPWKKAISLYFPNFINFFFPQIYPCIDWEKGYEFLDTELQQIAPDAEVGLREADKLIKVWRLDGKETWVLIHIEVQSQFQSDFAERMYIYSNRIFDLYRQQVVSLAILADEQRNWRPTEYYYDIWGCQVLLRFPTVKLLDYSSAMLEESINPFAVIVQAHLKTQQTRQDIQSRYQEKLRIAKSLYQRGYNRQDIIELFRLIDWLMTLPTEIEKGFKQEIRRYEEENKMPYVPSVERLTRAEDIIKILEIRFGEVPSQLVEIVDEIKDDEIQKMLLEQAVTVNSLLEFQKLIDQIPFEQQDNV